MKPLRLVLAGAAIGNGNRGVEGLGRSVAQAVNDSTLGSRLTILDDGWGVRAEPSGRYTDSMVELVGVRRSRRWYRPESWARVRLDLARGGGRNQVAQRLTQADAVLDISGGDSFTDMYGPDRLLSICAPKKAAIQARRPLVLLPQTIGPFDSRNGRSTAIRILRRATVVYARDPLSYERLIALAGPGSDQSRLRQGVDVAFALTSAEPDDFVKAIFERLSDDVIAGVNVSGLLLTDAAQKRFALTGDYLATMTDLVRNLVREGAYVILFPHVHVPGGGGESDQVAIDALLSRLDSFERERTTSIPNHLDASQLKWCVEQTDWFVGSRMHATIAGLSSLVPTYGYAYSDKAKGVFATCGMSSQVADARKVSGDEAVRLMLASFADRGRTQAELAQQVPQVNARARRQLADLLSEVNAWRTSPVGPLG
ncbi:MAG TPA: polysaccharide pyruvyl transferase family protein [Propionibacteriaceae bacterium]|nr:polysaccharide pyruvyl transferase family protein [Propionibacteriaceae bacterium]